MRSTVIAFLFTGAVLALTAAVGSQTLPAPTEDRVGYPEGYATNYTLMYTLDRPDNAQVRVIYGNGPAAAAKPGEAVPYGAIYVMETWSTRRDAQNNILFDDKGRYQRNALGGVFVMRKEPGFGTAYAENRNGEWEYVAFRPDRTYLNPPSTTGSCAVCHLQVRERDFVFRTGLTFKKASGAVPTAAIQHYTFLPGNITVPRNATVTWYNDDVAHHRIRFAGGVILSDEMPQGASFEHTFTAKGQYDYQCSLHPAMRAAVFVDPAVLQISNTTNGLRNPDFRAGDTWSLQLNNATPNAQVYLRIFKNGADLGTSGPHGGSTDAQGRWLLTGTAGVSEVGAWRIQAVAGSATAADKSPFISFNVVN